jgi:hypothetical protein
MSSQDVGSDAPAAPASSSTPGAPDAPGSPLPGDTPADTTWEWVNPSPQGNRIRGMGGTANDDVWLVGDGNTVLHWDGERWNDERRGLRGIDLYSVWAAGRNDVWAVGDHGVRYRFNDYAPAVSLYERLSEPGGGVILHFDGTAWTPDPTIGTRWAHAVSGTSSSNVLALLEGGDIARYDGKAWAIANAGAVLRDVWASSATNAWAVGPKGALMHFDGTAWRRVAKMDGSLTDPAAESNDYYGVWGASADDVWAVFVDQTDAANVLAQTIGFAHWNGAGWSVTQRERTDMSIEADYCRDTDAPLRLGHAIWGAGPSRALATTRDAPTIWSYDGTRWSTQKSDGTIGIRTVWGAAGNGDLVAAGEGGALFRWDGSFLPVFSGYRGRLSALSVAGHEAWAVATETGAGELVRWSPGGWSPVDLHGVSATGVLVRSASDVWVAGQHQANDGTRPYDVLRWDGSSWTAMPAPSPPSIAFDHIWAPKTGGSVWMLGGDSIYASPLYRFTGTSWVKIDLPGNAIALDVSGTSDTDVWVVATTASHTMIVFHFDGGTWTDVFHPAGAGYGARINVAAPNDVWVRTGEEGIIGTPHLMYHFDGKTWFDRRDLDTSVVWPAGSGRAYFITFDGAETAWSPSDMRVMLGYWDGQKKTIVGETSAGVYLLGGSDDTLWIGGGSGATLRYGLRSAPH